ncbi:hypothetical protein [Gottfriedia solisilvae]|uniref:Uncharacterized protein n=1 Tax=Gottfriedia solisilvae TaxID=1516104 RepID=A0A8J3F2D9_9BACI|nr:hypothetical protein [Gottfriedia solisilvae]GGI17869.1 hypothetical protein GCM10007380_40090 [Gottfriedia solisilvae]
MRLILRIFVVLITLILGLFIFIKLNPKIINIVFPKVEKNIMIYHSSSASVKILKKYIKKEKGNHFYVDVQNKYTPFEKYSISVKNKNTWNAICVDQSYFVNVGWDSYDWSHEIPSITYLLEITDFYNIKITYLNKKCTSVN